MAITTPSDIHLRPYQADAVEAIGLGLRDGGRGQLHAACGAGKTIIGIVAAERLVPGDGLLAVFVPSLALASQIIAAWRSAGRIDELLAVCSDDTVADAPVHTDDLDAEVTTDADAISAWLRASSGRQLIVSTYLSAPRLAEALKATGRHIDLAVFDEAHHLAGRPDFMTRRVLDDAHLPARRRLYMTATPRIDDVRMENSGGLSMDDTTVFGPVLHNYPWARAISDGYLDDYRIVIMGVTESQVREMLQDDQRTYTDRPGDPDLRMLAAQAVLAKAARQYGLRRILAFCPRLDTAREFAATLPSTVRRLPASQRPAGGLHAARVSGEMNARQREAVLGQLRKPPGGWTVVTNVRCLSEGVDVPAVDAVAFTHPKRSQVDIVQAVGRALRRSPDGQGTATIIVPIVIPDSAEDISDLEPGEFRTLWQVIRALRAHDETLGIELDVQRSHDPSSNPQLPSRITIQLPPGASDDVLAQIRALAVRQTTSSWWEGYGHAREFHTEHGSLDVPSSYTAPGGFRLGQWILNARQHRRKGWMRPDRVTALDAIGMRWNTTSTPWHRLVEELKAYREQHGHTLVPQTYISPTGYALGSKINSTRTRRHRVPSQISQVLDDLGMVWNTRDLAWQELHTHCYQYQEQYGDLNVPKGYITEDGYTLGVRLKGVRKRWREGRLDPAEQASLEELGMRFADTTDTAWAAFLTACDRYVAAFGSLAGVRKDYTDAEGYRLGQSISYYRNLHNGTKRGAAPIPENRKTALDERGMVWRLAPARDITEPEREALRLLNGTDLAREIIRLIDEESTTQSSIADALGAHRSYLNTKIKAFRATGTWTERTRRTAPPPAIRTT